LYAAITTNKNIYQDYPEIMGAAGYSGTIELPTPSPTSTTSSGGGGGSSVPSGEEFKNIERKETYEKYISKDAPTSYVFRQAGNPISEVLITSNINAGDIAVKIEVLRGISSLSSPAPGTVYKNINILVGKSGFAVPKNIKEAVIKFRVENSWITSNNLASSDVC
jgi:PGF-pre-PGF domain-containing protein